MCLHVSRRTSASHKLIMKYDSSLCFVHFLGNDSVSASCELLGG
jgi:hypothetical protein